MITLRCPSDDSSFCTWVDDKTEIENYRIRATIYYSEFTLCVCSCCYPHPRIKVVLDSRMERKAVECRRECVAIGIFHFWKKRRKIIIYGKVIHDSKLQIVKYFAQTSTIFSFWFSIQDSEALLIPDTRKCQLSISKYEMNCLCSTCPRIRSCFHQLNNPAENRNWLNKFSWFQHVYPSSPAHTNDNGSSSTDSILSPLGRLVLKLSSSCSWIRFDVLARLDSGIWVIKAHFYYVFISPTMTLTIAQLFTLPYKSVLENGKKFR